jgi:hypothetical protein
VNGRGALAALWLLDAVLQYQTFMFSQGFPRMLAATATGNPGLVAGPVTWSARLIGTHPGAVTAVGRVLPDHDGRRPGLHADLDALTAASP